MGSVAAPGRFHGVRTIQNVGVRFLHSASVSNVLAYRGKSEALMDVGGGGSVGEKALIWDSTRVTVLFLFGIFGKRVVFKRPDIYSIES